MSRTVLAGALAMLVGAGYLVVMWLKPAPQAAAGPPPAEEIVYICRDTGELLRGPRRTTPAVNPATGRPTLVQAFYCTECQAWHPAPLAEFAERMPAGPVCPVHRCALAETGPRDQLPTLP